MNDKALREELAQGGLRQETTWQPGRVEKVKGGSPGLGS